MVSRDDFSDEVAEIVFRLDDGEISQMITTGDGYYFIKCLNKYHKELTEENKKNIVERRRRRLPDEMFTVNLQSRRNHI